MKEISLSDLDGIIEKIAQSSATIGEVIFDMQNKEIMFCRGELREIHSTLSMIERNMLREWRELKNKQPQAKVA